jgi:drug/metabolite transporter (DMT)-like permease
MTPDIGQIAALLTALCYSISSIFFTFAGKKYGSMVSNRIRLVIAVLLLGIVHWIVFGTPLPANAGIQRWFWLGISGVAGLAIGDLFLFQTYITLGPRIGMLFLSLSPAIATVLAWLFLGETLSRASLVGISLTLVGITWVVLVSNQNGNSLNGDLRELNNSVEVKGTIAGLMAAAGQALGVVLAKIGLKGDFPALSGNVIRMSSAFLAIWVFTLFQGQVGTTIQHVNAQKAGLMFLLVGAIFGPLIGVSLALFAIQRTSIGIASTLIALPPIFLLPLGHFFFKEKISWQSILGTLMAVTGVGILFWF